MRGHDWHFKTAAGERTGYCRDNEVNGQLVPIMNDS